MDRNVPHLLFFYEGLMDTHGYNSTVERFGRLDKGAVFDIPDTIVLSVYRS